MGKPEGAVVPPYIPVELRLRGDIPGDRLTDAIRQFSELAAASSLDVVFYNPPAAAVQPGELAASGIAAVRTATREDFMDHGRDIGVDGGQAGKAWHTLTRRHYLRTIGSEQSDFNAASVNEARSLIFPVFFETVEIGRSYRDSVITDLNVPSLGFYVGWVKNERHRRPTKPRIDVTGMDVGEKKFDFWESFYHNWPSVTSE